MYLPVIPKTFISVLAFLERPYLKKFLGRLVVVICQRKWFVAVSKKGKNKLLMRK